MKASQYPYFTVKEIPADAEIISHKLMIRAGLIRKLAAGVYTWLPLGLRVLRKVENIVREEMNRSGALEVLMPAVQPAELWKESGRWDFYGPELLRLQDRHVRDFCFGPTHEEVITDLVRREIHSYKTLPINLYQIQTKFRDEIRPRFGVMRAREFIMKDAYSFHMSQTSLNDTYQVMFETYQRIFSRFGLKFCAVHADTGNIGGSLSHEFHVLADSGEDAIAFSTSGNYASNVELVPAPAPNIARPEPSISLKVVDTPRQHTIEEVSHYLAIPPHRCLKTLIVCGSATPLVALVLRGDHELNKIKAEKLTEVATPLTFASEEMIRQQIGCGIGSIGPVGLNIPVVIDQSAAVEANFVCGANQDGKHLTGVNWDRDLPLPSVADLRNVVDGDPTPDGKELLKIARGIEVGHIFQLGKKYTEALGVSILNEEGENQTLIMGCYGIGVSRIVAAAIEQNYDEHGILWPNSIAPFQVGLVPINAHRSPQVLQATENLYQNLLRAGIDVLYDDRESRPGVMFADLDLIGVPHRIVIGDRHLAEGKVEYKSRLGGQGELFAMEGIVEWLKTKSG